MSVLNYLEAKLSDASAQQLYDYLIAAGIPNVYDKGELDVELMMSSQSTTLYQADETSPITPIDSDTDYSLVSYAEPTISGPTITTAELRFSCTGLQTIRTNLENDGMIDSRTPASGVLVWTPVMTISYDIEDYDVGTFTVPTFALEFDKIDYYLEDSSYVTLVDYY